MVTGADGAVANTGDEIATTQGQGTGGTATTIDIVKLPWAVVPAKPTSSRTQSGDPERLSFPQI
jgi:hypothetical protein